MCYITRGRSQEKSCVEKKRCFLMTPVCTPLTNKGTVARQLRVFLVGDQRILGRILSDHLLRDGRK